MLTRLGSAGAAGLFSHVYSLAGTNFLNRCEQVPLYDAKVGELILGNVKDDNADLIFGKVLLELNVPIDCHEHVKLILCRCKQGAIFQGVPASIVNRGDSVIPQEQLDARVYA